MREPQPLEGTWSGEDVRRPALWQRWVFAVEAVGVVVYGDTANFLFSGAVSTGPAPSSALIVGTMRSTSLGLPGKNDCVPRGFQHFLSFLNLSRV